MLQYQHEIVGGAMMASLLITIIILAVSLHKQ